MARLDLSLLRYSIITLVTLTGFDTSQQQQNPTESWPTASNEVLPDGHTNPKYSWSNSKQDFIRDIISMAKDFPHQKRETWIQLISAIGHTLEDEPPQHPAVITVLLLPNISSEFSTCFLKKVATVLNKAVLPMLQGQNDESTWQYTGPHILSPKTFEGNSITSVRNKIEAYLSTKGKSLLVLDIDKFQHEKDLMVFHGLCDNSNAVDSRATILFPVPVPMETFEKYPSWNHTDGGDISNEVLSNAWRDVVRPNIGPALVARIADAVILLHDGDTCKDDNGPIHQMDNAEIADVKMTYIGTCIVNFYQFLNSQAGQPAAVEEKKICLPEELGSHGQQTEDDKGNLNLKEDLTGATENPTSHEIIEGGDVHEQNGTGFTDESASMKAPNKLPNVPTGNDILGEETASGQEEENYCSQEQAGSQWQKQGENEPDVDADLQVDCEQHSVQPETHKTKKGCDEEGDDNGASATPTKGDPQNQIHSKPIDNGSDTPNDDEKKRPENENIERQDPLFGKVSPPEGQKTLNKPTRKHNLEKDSKEQMNTVRNTFYGHQGKRRHEEHHGEAENGNPNRKGSKKRKQRQRKQYQVKKNKDHGRKKDKKNKPSKQGNANHKRKRYKKK